MPRLPSTHRNKQPLRCDHRLTDAQKLRSTYRWQKLRRRQREQFPLCCAPYHEGPICPATEVHHIKPVATHPQLAFEPRNCIPLCHECHLAADGKQFPRWWEGEYVKTEGGVKFVLPDALEKTRVSESGGTE